MIFQELLLFRVLALRSHVRVCAEQKAAGAAAGAAVQGRVDAAHGDHGDVLAELDLLAHGHAEGFLRRVEPGGNDGLVAPDDFVGRQFRLADHFIGDRRSVLGQHVDGHVVFTHVETVVLHAEQLVEPSGQDVLAGMVLHEGEAFFPVYPAKDGFRRCKARHRQKRTGSRYQGAARNRHPRSAVRQSHGRYLRR